MRNFASLCTTTLLGFSSLLSLPIAAHELYRSSLFPAPVQKDSSASPEVLVAPFAYDALSGPLNWYGLNESGNSLCDTGRHQSPIDILPSSLNDKSVSQVSGSNIQVDIPNVDSALIENIGSTVEIVTKGTLKSADGTKYSLVQFHYHTPGEHRLNGEWMAMELHFLFESKDAKFAVLTFLFDLSSTQQTEPLSAAVMASMQDVSSPGDSSKTGPLNFSNLLTHFRQNDMFSYIGSITSPPCNEDVLWLISAKPVPLDVESLKQARKVMKFNARYTQDAVGGENLLEKSAKNMVSGGLVHADNAKKNAASGYTVEVCTGLRVYVMTLGAILAAWLGI